MDAPKLFITGVTGYIGGDAFHEIYTAHPDWHYTCSVRNSDKGSLVAQDYPSVHLVYGDLDDLGMIEEEASKADVVLHFASADHEGAAAAIAKGLSQHSVSHPGIFIHTTGGGNLCYNDVDSKTYGEEHPKVYDDVKDVHELVNLPDHASHRAIEKIVLAANSPNVKTGIVNPPTIYGVGRGPGNKRSMQIPGLAECFLKLGKAFQVNRGQNFWSSVHIHDLSQAYRLLAESAIAGPGGKASWGPSEGYFFTESDEHRWCDLSVALAQKAQKMGLLKTDEVDSLSPEEVEKMHRYGSVLWGCNSRSRASRLRRELGWTPRGPGIEDTFEEALKLEAKKRNE